MIGSGPIVIGQAAEFDYAGTQACRRCARRASDRPGQLQPGHDHDRRGVADVVYVEPLTVEVVERIIERERPDGLLPTLGGQTGLNLAVAAAPRRGVLDRYGVRLLGTRLESIKMAEDRELFKQLLDRDRRAGRPSAIATHDRRGARAFATNRLPADHPARLHARRHRRRRRATRDELDRDRRRRPRCQPDRPGAGRAQSLLGWKEIEYEVMRDGADTCITICNMENLDPMGVHTGDSSWSRRARRSPTTSTRCCARRRSRSSARWASRAAATSSSRSTRTRAAYYVIEVNPRVSRSSALASKATGYPIARVAAKIAIGKPPGRDPERGHPARRRPPSSRRSTTASSRSRAGPFDKFAAGDRPLGTQMKATGEVMAIDRSFEAALQKAVRSLEIGGRSTCSGRTRPGARTPIALALIARRTTCGSGR